MSPYLPRLAAVAAAGAVPLDGSRSSEWRRSPCAELWAELASVSLYFFKNQWIRLNAATAHRAAAALMPRRDRVHA